ncbi:indole-3-glycerol phosphate synthase TrpC [Alkalibacillus haloalkaliphilus]|uniref:indole-3-glycerol phosphate synthase TrpC n=1 Tax=Alkalibacillus haloalkaliphilus TaxID=94136 RepID=UPI0002E74E3A|nr:indole-3-glycerol phosphate synthase TrpC [Alkalibacillus haloalkaliphilus]
MGTILDRILDKKREEVELLKSQPALEGEGGLNQNITPLYDSLRQSNQLSIIAEIKRASPSKGDINVGMEPPEQAKLYEQSGATAISVLTDQPFFKGTIEDLKQVRETVQLPVLCKDFIIDKVQIDRAKRAGANVILLIAAALPKEQLKALYNYALTSGLEVLFEVHNEEELKMATSLEAKIIGINNRDLKTFKTEISVTEQLASQIEDPNVMIISESGIKTSEDAKRVSQAGANGILVGETLMRSENVSDALHQLIV